MAKEPPSRRYQKARGLLRATTSQLRCGACEIYFVKAATLGLIKIGKADNARTRFRTMRTMSPDTLVLLGVMVCKEAGALERRLHRRFAAHRSHGEWFRPAPELVQFIAENVASPEPETHWRVLRGRAA